MLRAVPPLTSLKCFEVAARFESFTLAAEHLLRAPSAVSYQIRLLEDYLGKPLFVRTGKKVLLTDDGRIYFEQVRAAFDLISNATREIRSGDSQRESIRISVAPSFGNAWLTPHLASFFDLYPELELRVITEKYPTNFGDGQIDCEIRYGDRALGKLEALPLCTERLVPLCSPSLLQKTTDLAGFLENATLIHNESRDIDWQDYLSAYKVQRNTAGKSLFFDRSTYALDVAREGLGVALESTILADQDLRSGRLVAPLGMTGIAGATYQLVAPDAERMRSDKISAFYNWLHQSLHPASQIDLLVEPPSDTVPRPNAPTAAR